MPKPDPWTLDGVRRLRRHRRALNILRPASVLIGATVVGGVIGAAPYWHPGTRNLQHAEQLTSCRVTDGDTIRCGSERIRLLGIDAPELPGHCRPGRDCAPGDPYASSRSLLDAVGIEMTIERVGEDRYGRVLAMVAGPHGDLSCWQLRHKQAIYKRGWDNGLRVAATCPTAIW